MVDVQSLFTPHFDVAEFWNEPVPTDTHAPRPQTPNCCVEEVEVRGHLPLSEFVKAGGSAKCLTLRLDGEEAAAWKLGRRGLEPSLLRSREH